MVRINKGRRHQDACKYWCFQEFSITLKGLPLSQAEVRNLKNTVWKTTFRTLRAEICPNKLSVSKMGPAEVQCVFVSPNSGGEVFDVNFGR